MKILFILFLVAFALAVAGLLIYALTRDVAHARIERQRNRDALAGAQIALHQIQTFSEDTYATNLAKVALDDMEATLAPKRRKSITD